VGACPQQPCPSLAGRGEADEREVVASSSSRSSPLLFLPTHPPNLWPATMDAVKDLADSGKVFVRDGNAVRPSLSLLLVLLPARRGLTSLLSTLILSLDTVHHPLHKARQEGSVPLPPLCRPLPTLTPSALPPLPPHAPQPLSHARRVRPDLPRSRHRLRHDGRHRLPRQAHPRAPTLVLHLLAPSHSLSLQLRADAPLSRSQIPINNILVGGA